MKGVVGEGELLLLPLEGLFPDMCVCEKNSQKVTQRRYRVNGEGAGVGKERDKIDLQCKYLSVNWLASSFVPLQ